MTRQLTIGGALAAIGLATFFIVTSQEKTLGQQAGAQAGSQGRGIGGGGFGGGGIGGIGGGGFGGGGLGGLGGGGLGGGSVGIGGAAGIGGGSFGIGGLAGEPIRPSSATLQQRGLQVQRRGLQLHQGRPGMAGGFGAGRGSEDKVSAAQRTLMEADTDEARQAAEKELREALVAEFETDMQRRAEELESIKKRVADMEAVLEKRTDAKDEIIDLRLEVLIQEAEGLGWSAAPHRRGASARMGGASFRAPPSTIRHLRVHPPAADE